MPPARYLPHTGGISFESIQFNIISLMDAKSFFIEFLYGNKTELAEVKPCCLPNNAFYYDVSIKNSYQFTVTPTADEERGMTWKVSLKNADKHVDSKMIDIIGEEIEKHLLQKAFS